MDYRLKKIIKRIFFISQVQDHIVLSILGLKLKFLNPAINRLQNNCCIANLEKHIENHTFFPHPVGICICPDAIIGEGCHIFQNVTIGMGKYNPDLKTAAPIIGNKVVIWANAVVCGGIKIGNNSVIGANSLVIKDVPPNTVYAGNPARFIRNVKPEDYRKVNC